MGDHFEKIIARSIQSGRYSSVSEVIRAGLRLIEEREQKIDLLKEAIEAGQNSGYVKNFDPVEYLKKINAKHSK